MLALKSTTTFLFFIFSSCLVLEAEDWNHSSGSYKSERYYEGNQITSTNVSNLEVAWKYSSFKIDDKFTVQSSPNLYRNKNYFLISNKRLCS